MIAAALLPLRSDPKQPVRPPKRPWPDQVLDLVIVDGPCTIFQVARQRYPAFRAVIQGLDQCFALPAGPFPTKVLFRR